MSKEIKWAVLGTGVIANEMAAGLQKMGAQPVDCCLASTPSMFMSTVLPELDYDGAIMITASHLPFNRNGMKFFTKNGGLESKDIKKILQKAMRGGIPFVQAVQPMPIMIGTNGGKTA